MARKNRNGSWNEPGEVDLTRGRFDGKPVRASSLPKGPFRSDGGRCLTPFMVTNVGPVPCRKCDVCQRQIVSDKVGRCGAEWVMAERAGLQTDFVTLTYGFDNRIAGTKNPDALSLNYDHIQIFLKRCRNYSDGLRYFVAGEYGDIKGRAHWHLILFWKGKPVPNIEYRERYTHWIETPDQARANGSFNVDGTPLWHHGTSFWKPFEYADYIKYVCKYCHKGIHGTKESKIQYSKKPPLGAEYFKRRAALHVEQQVPVRGFEYTIPDMRNRHSGELLRFWMFGVSREIYLRAFIEGWFAKYGNYDWPASELVEEYFQRAYVREDGGIRRRKLDDPLVADILFEDRRMLRNRSGLIGRRDFELFLPGSPGTEIEDHSAFTAREYMDRSQGW